VPTPNNFLIRFPMPSLIILIGQNREILPFVLPHHFFTLFHFLHEQDCAFSSFVSPAPLSSQQTLCGDQGFHSATRICEYGVSVLWVFVVFFLDLAELFFLNRCRFFFLFFFYFFFVLSVLSWKYLFFAVFFFF